MSVLAALPQERPPVDSLPIPEDVRADDSWNPFLREMADHIGAYATLKFIARYGGLQLSFPSSPTGWHVADVIGLESAATLCWAFKGNNKVDLPLGKAELFAARAAPWIAGLRAKTITYTDAAWHLHCSRSHLWHLVNRTDRAAKVRPLRRKAEDPRQIMMFDDEEMSA